MKSSAAVFSLSVLLVLFLSIGFPVAGQSSVELSAEEIITRLEENQTHETSRVVGRMVIHDQFGRRTSTFVMYTRGSDDALVEFTSSDEAGQKVLRTEDEIYLFYPDASELIRLQGSALRQSMLGSDVSYEDMTGNKSFLDNYDVELAGTERVSGTRCYVVEVEATSRDVAYPRQTLWIDTEDFALRKAEQYALSGRLLKVMSVQELMRQDDKVFPSHIVVEDQLKQDTSTEFIIEEAEIGVDLPPRIFSVEELTW